MTESNNKQYEGKGKVEFMPTAPIDRLSQPTPRTLVRRPKLNPLRGAGATKPQVMEEQARETQPFGAWIKQYHNPRFAHSEPRDSKAEGKPYLKREEWLVTPFAGKMYNIPNKVVPKIMSAEPVTVHDEFPPTEKLTSGFTPPPEDSKMDWRRQRGKMGERD